MVLALALKTPPLQPKRSVPTWRLSLQMLRHGPKNLYFFVLLLITLILVAIRNKRRRRGIGMPKFKSIAAYTASLPQDRDFYDVAVVGGSVSGSATALQLSRQKIKTIIFEKLSSFEGGNGCSEETTAIFGASAEILKTLGGYDDLVKSDCAHPVATIGVHSRRESVTMASDFNGCPPIIIKKNVLSQWLLTQAERAGATVQMKSAVIFAEFDKNDKMWTIHCQDRSYKSRVLVCADGGRATLARKLGLADGPADTILSVATVQAGSHRMGSFDVQIISRGGEVGGGYAALTRLAKDEVGISIYHSIDIKPEKVIQSVLSHPRVADALGPSAIVSSFTSHFLRFDKAVRLVSPHLVITGQAAALGNPFTFESLQFSLFSSRVATEILSEGFRSDDFSDKFLARYSERLHREFPRRTWWANAAHRLHACSFIVDVFLRHLRTNKIESLDFWAEFIAGAKPPSLFSHPTRIVKFFSSFLAFPKIGRSLPPSSPSASRRSPAASSR